MKKFKSKTEQLDSANKLLRKLAKLNTGGVSPAIKSLIKQMYINRIKKGQ